MSCKVHFKDESSSLSHYGVKGQRWGVRRYQNEDGSLTEEGKKKYGNLEGLSKEEIAKFIKRDTIDMVGNTVSASVLGSALGLELSSLLNDYGSTKVNAIPMAVLGAGTYAATAALATKIGRNRRIEKYKKNLEKQKRG